MIEYILTYIFSIFNKKNVRLVIYYGNKQGKDIDVFVVVAGESEYNCIHQGHFDVTYIGEKWLKSMINHLDPLLTEPVLTGDVLYGSVGYIKDNLSNVDPSKKVVNYLTNKTLQYHEWANAHFQNGDLVYACDCARFSLGFYCFATHYQNCTRITTFSTVLNESNDKRALIKKITTMAKNKEKLTFVNVKYILTKTHEILTNL